MTNELEKQFFETFGIEPDITSCYHRCKKDLNCKECNEAKVIYPQITDHILLELIFLQPLSIEFKYPRNIKELKNTLLGYYIEELSLFAEPSEAEIFKQQVRTLFKDGNKTIQNLRTHCKHIDETNKILYNEKVQLLDKNQELQDKLLKLNDLAHEVLLYELQTLDIDFDEYETHIRDTEFSPIVTRCTEMIDLIGYSNKCNKEA